MLRFLSQLNDRLLRCGRHSCALKACVLVIVLTISAATSAAPPNATWLHPSGASRGSTVKVQAGGTFTTWPVQAAMDPTQGVAMKPLKDKGIFEITVAADATPGLRWLRIYNHEGASTLRPFIVGTLPEIDEKETNDITPQVVEGSVVVNAKFGKRGDSDVYQIALKKGQTLVASLDGHRLLGSPIDASLQVADERGFVLREIDDTCGLDPRIIFTAPRDGNFLIRAFAFPAQPSSSISYTGGEDHVYRLTLTTAGFVDHAFPMAVDQTNATEVSLFGWNLPTDGVKVKPIVAGDTAVAFHTDSANALELLHTKAQSFRVDALQSKTNSMSPPFVVSGRLASANETARVRFTAKKGKAVRFHVDSRSLGYPLDALLKIEDGNGKVLIEKDDLGRDARDPQLDFKPPADGGYVAVVSDLHGRGGFRFVYRLSALPVEPSFQLTLDKDSFVVAGKKPADIPVKIARLDGHKDDITVRVEGLPANIVATPVKSLSKGATAKAITLQIKSDGKAWSGPIRIVSDKVDQQPQAATFSTPVPDRTHDRVWLTVKAEGK